MPALPMLVPDDRLDSLARLALRHFAVTSAWVARTDAHQRCTALHGRPPAAASSHDWPSFMRPGLDTALLVVPDTRADRRFSSHPLVLADPGIRFYAGYPLASPDGARLGAFFLLDGHPRQLDGEQLDFLRDLGRLAAHVLAGDQAEAERRQQAAARRIGEDRMALAISGSGTGIWDRDMLTGESHYSPGWKALLGYAPAELGSKDTDADQRVHPDDMARVQDAIQAHFDQLTQVYAVEHRLRCKDGSYKWVATRGKVVSRDGQGKPLRMIGTTTDITPMREMSERLRRSAELITSLTNEVPGLVFQYRRFTNGEAFFSYASAGIRDIYEIPPEWVASDASILDRIIHPDDLAAYHASLTASAANLAPWHLEYRVLLPEQGLRWRQGDARPQRLEDGSTLWHGFITDITERKRIEAELHGLATTDFLTQLPNRRHFMAQIIAELASIRRDHHEPAAILMCDLDHFKAINDRWGHAMGDMALRHFADLLRGELRKTDVAGRMGGEEFAVMLRGAEFESAMAFAHRLQRRTQDTPLREAGRHVPLSVSIGITIMDGNDAGADSALSRSDLALYRAKENGRNRIEYQW